MNIFLRFTTNAIIWKCQSGKNWKEEGFRLLIEIISLKYLIQWDKQTGIVIVIQYSYIYWYKKILALWKDCFGFIISYSKQVTGLSIFAKPLVAVRGVAKYLHLF